MFNEYMWQTYLKAGGKEVVKLFESELVEENTAAYASKIYDLHTYYCPSDAICKFEKNSLEEFYSDFSGDSGFWYGCYSLIGLPDGYYSIDDLMQLFYNGFFDETVTAATQVFDEFTLGMAYYTTFLSIMFPELFIPYYFKYNFNVLEKIAQEFEIELPSMPVKKDYKGRFFYYGEICAAFQDFREEHNMTPYELYAFLYDFAPKYIGGIDSYIIKDLPEPKSAFFIGGSKDDLFLSDDAETNSAWQCNPETRAGDMIVMYLKSPVSAVSSVWRSVSIGFNDPFFYYYRCTYIAQPTAIKQISQKQLQKDEIFKNIPIVRKNMQGINGVELKPSEYNHLMDLAKADAPRLKFDITDGNLDLVNEKDVENKLIKPLIAKLGYHENDYVQQLYIEIGNHNHALIPDFVMLPDTTRGHQSAFAIIEAKHKITNKKELEEVKIQARSYAVQLKTKYSAIADKNKVWVYTEKDDFTNEIFEATWNELNNNADTFSALFKLIGKK